MPEEKKAAGKPIYKKWWFWAIITFLAIGGLGAASGSDDEAKDGNAKPVEAELSAPEEENTELAKLKLSPRSVNNDVTGKWYISSIAEPIVVDELAYDYYKKYMKDDEIHFVVNFTYKTTTQISKNAAGINVVVREYVDKEEHDAKKLGSGMKLKEYYYDAGTGEKFGLKGNDDF